MTLKVQFSLSCLPISAGFYKNVDSQAAEAFIRGNIWHNGDTNKTFEFFAYRITADVLNSYDVGVKSKTTFMPYIA